MTCIIVSERFLKVFTGKFASAIALWPFVILRNREMKVNTVLLNHEKIHLRQQAELLIVFFYLWYLSEYFIRWYLLKNKRQAYYQISFEREAYAHEADQQYLKSRKMYAFLRFVCRKAKA